jgi:hypothetical protein
VNIPTGEEDEEEEEEEEEDRNYQEAHQESQLLVRVNLKILNAHFNLLEPRG